MNEPSTHMAVAVASRHNEVAARPSFFDLPHQEQLSFATEVANTLAKVIYDRGLVTKFGDNDYVEVEGWNIMGTFLGIFPRERSVKRHPDGTWEAYVDLVSLRSGAVVGGASHICSPDERGKRNMPDAARRSMAVTRAVGKAYRMSFSWVMALAGVKPTPAEEMATVVETTDGPYEGTDAQKRLLKEEMSRQGVDLSRLRDVSERMAGRQMTDLAAVIKEVTGH